MISPEHVQDLSRGRESTEVTDASPRREFALDSAWKASLMLDGPTGIAEGVADDVALRASHGFPVTVPGQIHADLEAEGLIPDPFFDDNEKRVAWVGHSDWRYATVLNRPNGRYDRADLVFDGLDTIATVALDGRPLGSTANMHRSYRFDVTESLRDGSELTVDFTSPYTYTAELEKTFGRMPGPYSEPFGLIRKMACSFGWDWGPTVVTAGIWRGASIETWSTARIAGIRPLTASGTGGGTLDLRVALERVRPAALVARVIVTGPGVDLSLDVAVDMAAEEIEAIIDVTGALAWWPRGYGDQPLYDVVVVLLDAGSLHELDRAATRVGFRTVTIDTGTDETGSACIILINGTPIEVRGFNWIPDHILPARMTAPRYRGRIQSAVDVGANLLRVWGGGIYESHDFYEACDEVGMLVWQDFAFACSSYPEADPIRSEVIAEATENVVRLSAHPSLVVWNGNNENLWLHDQDGWSDELAGRAWGSDYYLTVLPEIVATLDPSRPYMAGSPWSGSVDIDANSPDHGTFHSWEVWNRVDYVHYRDTNPRFVSEFGWQAPPAWRTMRDAVSDEPMRSDSPGVAWHQKASGGDRKIERGIEDHFGVGGTEFGRWHFLAQLTQVRAISAGVEHWRAHWPHTAGVILWQLNDLWPVSSWSAFDSEGRAKPLAHELRRLYADRSVSLEREGGALVLSLTNATGTPWSATIDCERWTVDGAIVATDHTERIVPPHSVSRIALPDAIAALDDPDREFIAVSAGLPDRVYWFGSEDRAIEWQRPNYSVEMIQDATGSVVRIEAASIVRDLLLQPDRIHPDARADCGFLTLLPGDIREIRLTGVPVVDADLTRPFVLTTLAEILAG